jgi:hypothetical protein
MLSEAQTYSSCSFEWGVLSGWLWLDPDMDRPKGRMDALECVALGRESTAIPGPARPESDRGRSSICRMGSSQGVNEKRPHATSPCIKTQMERRNHAHPPN